MRGCGPRRRCRVSEAQVHIRLQQPPLPHVAQKARVYFCGDRALCNLVMSSIGSFFDCVMARRLREILAEVEALEGLGGAPGFPACLDGTWSLAYSSALSSGSGSGPPRVALLALDILLILALAPFTSRCSTPHCQRTGKIGLHCCRALSVTMLSTFGAWNRRRSKQELAAHFPNAGPGREPQFRPPCTGPCAQPACACPLPVRCHWWMCIHLFLRCVPLWACSRRPYGPSASRSHVVFGRSGITDTLSDLIPEPVFRYHLLPSALQIPFF